MNKKIKYLVFSALIAISFMFLTQVSFSQSVHPGTITSGKKFFIYFGEDSTHITVDASEVLDKLVAHGKKTKGQRFLITGFFHEYEKDGLAAKRAEAVKEYCVMLGMSESQIITRHTKQILAQNEEGIFEEKDRIKARRAELMFIDAP
jgi:outer membrane protein OmpA-like peptidoglycan-associated protein